LPIIGLREFPHVAMQLAHRFGADGSSFSYTGSPFQMGNAGLPIPTYGSDRSGIICGFLIAPEVPAQAVDAQEALEWLARGPSRGKGEFLWLDFNLTNVAAEKWMREHLALPDGFWDALRDGSQSTRIEYVDETLIAVVNDVLFDFAFGASDISTLWLSVDPRVVVSARRKPLRAIDRLRAAVKRGVHFRSSVELLIHLLHDQADVLVNILRDATGRVDRIEDSLLAGRLETRRLDLGALRRVLVRLQRLLAPEPAALFRFLNRPPPWIVEADVQELRESSEEFSVALNDMTALVERIKLLQEEIAAQVNQQNNRSLFLLTIFTVLALPINIIAGLFGMNVGGIPLAQNESGFWVIVGVVAAFTLAAVWLVFRRRGN
jgi:zinc transporter